MQTCISSLSFWWFSSIKRVWSLLLLITLVISNEPFWDNHHLCHSLFMFLGDETLCISDLIFFRRHILPSKHLALCRVIFIFNTDIWNFIREEVLLDIWFFYWNWQIYFHIITLIFPNWCWHFQIFEIQTHLISHQ